MVSPSDFLVVLKQLGEKITEEEIDELMKEADADGNGYISFDEFKKIISYADPEKKWKNKYSNS